MAGGNSERKAPEQVGEVFAVRVGQDQVARGQPVPWRVAAHQAASAEEAIAHEEESTRKYCEWSGEAIPPGAEVVPELVRDVLGYHFRFRPHEHSTLIYEWNDIHS